MGELFRKQAPLLPRHSRCLAAASLLPFCLRHSGGQKAFLTCPTGHLNHSLSLPLA